MVQAARGPETYEFAYGLLGGAAALATRKDGSLRSDVFLVPRSVAIGADDEIYEAGAWRLLPGARVAFDFEDSNLPARAFPYELDPTTTFSVSASADDGYVYKTGNLYPPDGVAPPEGGSGTNTTSSILGVRRSKSIACLECGTYKYEIRNSFLRWDTSSLPDNAVVSAATLRAYVFNAWSDDGRSLTADWYTSWPIDTADYSETAQASAITGINIQQSVPADRDVDFTLLNARTNVSLTGYSGLRLHISGSQVTGANEVQLVSFDDVSYAEPRLLVTYSTPPSITAVSDSPDPVTAGALVSFSVQWADADSGDQVRARICKTSAISSGVCSGGTWAVGPLSATSPSGTSYWTHHSDLGTRTYYAFACDAANVCSSSSIQGTFTVQNAVPAITSVSDSPDPVTAGNSVSFSVGWSDPEDTVRAVVCKTDSISAAATCPGGAWASGALSSTSPSSVSYSTSAPDTGTNAYFGFACDASNVCSGSLSGAFTVQNRVPSITSVSDSPDPSSAGSTITFTVGWTDPGDSVKALICKTNSVSNGACSGGTWTTGNTSTTSPSVASYSSTAADVGIRTYFAFACDVVDACSASLSGTFTVQDQAPTIVSTADSPDLLNAGDTVTFTASWTDPDPGDSVKAVICKTNAIGAGTCSAGAWATGAGALSSPSTASYSTAAPDAGAKDYYAFVCDAQNVCSDSISGTFTVLDRAPTINSASVSPDPVIVGNALTFSVTWTDPDPADQERTVICKTNDVSSGACPGGDWAVGALSSNTPSTATYTPLAADVGAETYYAFICDAAGMCSPDPSAVSGTFAVQSPQLTATSASASPNSAAVSSTITFNTGWTSSRSGDLARAVICRTDSVSQGLCGGGDWMTGDLTSTSPATALFYPGQGDAGTHDYFAFVCDADNFCSSASVHGTFTVSGDSNFPSTCLGDDGLTPTELACPVEDLGVPEAQVPPASLPDDDLAPGLPYNSATDGPAPPPTVSRYVSSSRLTNVDLDPQGSPPGKHKQDRAHELGCKIARKINSGELGKDVIAILMFGSMHDMGTMNNRRHFSVSVYGAHDIGLSQVREVALSFAQGFFDCADEPIPFTQGERARLTLALGTSSYVVKTPLDHDAVEFDGGAAWAKVVKTTDAQVPCVQTKQNISFCDINVWAANDIEPGCEVNCGPAGESVYEPGSANSGWAYPTKVEEWINGYLSVADSSDRRLVNFGGSSCGSSTSCDDPGQWDLNGYYQVSWGFGVGHAVIEDSLLTPLPQMYNITATTGDQDSWYFIAKYARRDRGQLMVFEGELTQFRACQTKVNDGIQGNECDISEKTQPAPAWKALHNRLNGDSATQQPSGAPPFSTDITWDN